MACGIREKEEVRRRLVRSVGHGWGEAQPQSATERMLSFLLTTKVMEDANTTSIQYKGGPHFCLLD